MRFSTQTCASLKSITHTLTALPLLLITPSNLAKEARMMKSSSNRIFAAVAFLGAVTFALPVYAHAEESSPSVESGAKEMYQGAKQDVKDIAITSKVKSGLLTDPTTRSYAIHVDTVEGVVTLSGEVPSITVAKRAQHVAQSVENVKMVKNELRIQDASR